LADISLSYKVPTDRTEQTRENRPTILKAARYSGSAGIVAAPPPAILCDALSSSAPASLRTLPPWASHQPQLLFSQGFLLWFFIPAELPRSGSVFLDVQDFAPRPVERPISLCSIF